MIIGITGGSGAGKTTLLNTIEQRGARVIDCDAVYHELLLSNKALLAELNSAFPEVVEKSVLNRKALASIVFNDEHKLQRLNEITHRYIDEEVTRLIESSGYELIAIDAIALIESGLSKRCDVVIAVCAPLEERVSRLTKREGISEEYALERIKAQKRDAWYNANSDYVLQNSGTEEEFTLKCNNFLDVLLNSAETETSSPGIKAKLLSLQ